MSSEVSVCFENGPNKYYQKGRRLETGWRFNDDVIDVFRLGDDEGEKKKGKHFSVFSDLHRPFFFYTGL